MWTKRHMDWCGEALGKAGWNNPHPEMMAEDKDWGSFAWVHLTTAPLPPKLGDFVHGVSGAHIFNFAEVSGFLGKG